MTDVVVACESPKFIVKVQFLSYLPVKINLGGCYQIRKFKSFNTALAVYKVFIWGLLGFESLKRPFDRNNRRTIKKCNYRMATKSYSSNSYFGVTYAGKKVAPVGETPHAPSADHRGYFLI